MERDRRKAIRKLIYKNIKLVHSSFGTTYSYTRDISESGIFVARKDLPNIPKGTVIKMMVLEPIFDGVTFNMKVAHVSEYGVGMAFLDYDFRGRKFHIEELDDHLLKKFK